MGEVTDNALLHVDCESHVRAARGARRLGRWPVPVARRGVMRGHSGGLGMAGRAAETTQGPLAPRTARPRPHALCVARLVDREHWQVLTRPLGPDDLPPWRLAVRARDPQAAPEADRPAAKAMVALIQQQAQRRARRCRSAHREVLSPEDLDALRVQAPWLCEADLHRYFPTEPGPATAAARPVPVDQLPGWDEVYVYIDDTGSEFRAGATGPRAGAMVAVLSARPLASPAGQDGGAHMVDEALAKRLDWLDALAAQPFGVLGLRGTGSWESTLTDMLRVLFAALAARPGGPPARVQVVIEQAREHGASQPHALWPHAFRGAPAKGVTLKVSTKEEDHGLGWADVLAYGWQAHARHKLCLPRTLLSGLCPLPGSALSALLKLLDATETINAEGLVALARQAGPSCGGDGAAGALRGDPLRRIALRKLEQACAASLPGVWDAVLHAAEEALAGSQLGLRAQGWVAALLEQLARQAGAALRLPVHRRVQRLVARVRRRGGAVDPHPRMDGPTTAALRAFDPGEAAQEDLESITSALWSGQVERADAACRAALEGVIGVDRGRLLSLWGQVAAFAGDHSTAWERLSAAEAALLDAGASEADLRQTRAYALHAGLDLHPRPADWLDRAGAHLGLPADRARWGVALCARAAETGEAGRFDRWLVCKAARARAWPDLDSRALLDALLGGAADQGLPTGQPADGTWPITLLHAIFALNRSVRSSDADGAVDLLAAAVADPALSPRGRWRARAAAALAVRAWPEASGALRTAADHDALLSAWRAAGIDLRWRPPTPIEVLSAARWRRQVVPFLWV